MPELMSPVTHSGARWPSGRLSLTSSTAWGKRVYSLRGTGSVGSLYHLQGAQHTELEIAEQQAREHHQDTVASEDQQPVAGCTSLRSYMHMRKLSYRPCSSVTNCTSDWLQLWPAATSVPVLHGELAPVSGFSFIVSRMSSQHTLQLGKRWQMCSMARKLLACWPRHMKAPRRGSP